MRNRFLALGGAALLVLIVWFAAVYRPANARLGKVKADVRNAQAQVSQLQTELQRLQALKKMAPELRAKASKFYKALPSKPAVSDFIRLVQDAANKSGIDFLSIAPTVPVSPQAAGGAVPAPATSPAPSGAGAAAAPAQSAPAIQTISIGMTANGSFFPMKDFIHRLERLPRALKVNTFSVNAGAAGAQQASAKLSITLNLNIFVATAPAPAPTTPQTSSAPVPVG